MRPRLDRAALAEAFQILFNLPHGSIPAGRFAFEHLEQNGGQISFHLAPQTVAGFRPLRRRAIRHHLRRLAGFAAFEDASHAIRRRLWVAERPGACQQFVEDHTQRKHIAQRVDPLAAELLRTGITRSQQCALSYLSLRIAHQFGGAKIEQLDGAVRGHQYVGGLEVAVDNQVPVRKLHGLAYLKKKPDSRLHRQPAIGAISIPKLTVDVFHHQVRRAARSHAAIEQASDIGMSEGGQ